MSNIDSDSVETAEGSEEEAPAPAPRVKPNGKRRGIAAPAAVGVAPQAPTRFEKSTNEADQVWNELVGWLKAQGRSPYDVMIQVRRVWPPSPSNESIVLGRPFDGGAVAGNENEPPGSTLYEYVTRYIHLATAQGPASYDLIFMWKATGTTITTGRMPFDSPAAVRAALAGADAGRQGAGAAGGPQMPIYIDRPAVVPPPPQMQPPQGGMGYPLPYGYPPPPSGYGPTSMGMGLAAADSDRIARLEGALSEALAAAREGRQPNIPSATMPPTPPPPTGTGGLSDLDVNRIAARLATMMGAPAMTPPPAAVPPAAAPPPAGPAGLEGLLHKTAMGMTERIFTAAVSAVEKNIKESIGVGAPPHAEEVDDTPPAQVMAPEDPAAGMPWNVSDVGSKWGDGRDVKVALDKETGKLDFAGLAFANPSVTEKLIDVVAGLGRAATEIMQTIGRAQQPVGVGRPPMAAQVVPQIPAGAIDATPTEGNPGGDGGGWQAP